MPDGPSAPLYIMDMSSSIYFLHISGIFLMLYFI